MGDSARRRVERHRSAPRVGALATRPQSVRRRAGRVGFHDRLPRSRSTGGGMLHRPGGQRQGRRAIRERVELLRQSPPPHPVPRPADAATAVTPRAVPTGGVQRVPDPAQSRDRQLPPGTGAGEAFRQETLALEAPLGGYQLPPASLLADLPTTRGKAKTEPAELARQLEQTLASFGVEAKVTR